MAGRLRMASAASFIIPGLGIALLAIADQATKAIARGAAVRSQCVDVLPGFLQIVQSANTGIALGMLKGSSAYIAALSIPVAALLAVAYLSLAQRLQRLGIVLIAAGLLGNTIDRLARGAVTDFIYFPALPKWPGAFNLADAFLFIGAALIFLPFLSSTIAGRKKTKKLERIAAKKRQKRKRKR